MHASTTERKTRAHSASHARTFGISLTIALRAHDLALPLELGVRRRYEVEPRTRSDAHIAQLHGHPAVQGLRTQRAESKRGDSAAYRLRTTYPAVAQHEIKKSKTPTNHLHHHHDIVLQRR